MAEDGKFWFGNSIIKIFSGFTSSENCESKLIS